MFDPLDVMPVFQELTCAANIEPSYVHKRDAEKKCNIMIISYETLTSIRCKVDRVDTIVITDGRICPCSKEMAFCSANLQAYIIYWREYWFDYINTIYW